MPRSITVYLLCTLFVLVLFRTSGGDELKSGGDTWKIHGWVVDGQGKPIPDFVAATYWSANGKQWDEHGERIKIHRQADLGNFWKEEGLLKPFPDCTVKRLDSGEFVAIIQDRPRVSVEL